MSYSNKYFLVLARSVDIRACSWVWRDYDITISSMCGLELRKSQPATWARVLGWVLNHLQKNHCELAIAADMQRASMALWMLSNG